MGQQLDGGYDDLVLLFPAADRGDLRHSRDGEKAPSDRRIGHGPQVQRRMPVRAEGDEHDLPHDRRDRGQGGTLDFGGQGSGHHTEFFAHCLAGPEDILAPLELDPDYGDPDGRCRTHPADTRGAVQGRLYRKTDQGFHFHGRHSVTLDQNGHGRGRQVRQHVDRHRRDHEASPDQEAERQGQDEAAIPQRPEDQFIDHRRLLMNMAVSGDLRR